MFRSLVNEAFQLRISHLGSSPQHLPVLTPASSASAQLPSPIAPQPVTPLSPQPPPPSPCVEEAAAAGAAPLVIKNVEDLDLLADVPVAKTTTPKLAKKKPQAEKQNSCT